MEIPVTAGPWLVLGVVLGVVLPVLAVLAGVLLRRRPARGRPAAPPPADPGVDDLPGFLESPPGSAPAPAGAAGDWPALSAPAVPRPAPPPPEPSSPGGRVGTTAVLVAMAVTALLLIGTAAAVATARTSDDAHAADRDGTGQPVPSTPAAGPGNVSAELTFGGIVLERHAVGVTVAYPRVRVTAEGGHTAAEVELPTYNCLRADAPQDPVAAGCTRSVTEYARLSGPALTLRSDDAGLRVSGAFPVVRRPNGSPPVATGRIYELAVSAGPRDGRAGTGREAATGLLELAEDRAGTSEEGPNEITYG